MTHVSIFYCLCICVCRDGDGMGREVGFGKLDWIHGLLELDSWNGMGMDGQSRVRVELKLNTEYKICSVVKCMTVYVYNHGERKNIEQAMGMMPIDRFILF